MKIAINVSQAPDGAPWPVPRADTPAAGLVLNRLQAGHVRTAIAQGQEQSSAPPVAAIHLADLPGYGLADSDPATRQAAIATVSETAALAAVLCAELVWFVPTARRDRPAPAGRRPSYEDSLARIADALLELRFAADRMGTVLSVDCAGTGVVTSPVEAAELVDRVCSPWVGWHLDAGYAAELHDPRDWIETLGGRLRSVSAERFAAAADLHRQLEAARFGGLLVQ